MAGTILKPASLLPLPFDWEGVEFPVHLDRLRMLRINFRACEKFKAATGRSLDEPSPLPTLHALAVLVSILAAENGDPISADMVERCIRPEALAQVTAGCRRFSSETSKLLEAAKLVSKITVNQSN